MSLRALSLRCVSYAIGHNLLSIHFTMSNPAQIVKELEALDVNKAVDKASKAMKQEDVLPHGSMPKQDPLMSNKKEDLVKMVRTQESAMEELKFSLEAMKLEHDVLLKKMTNMQLDFEKTREDDMREHEEEYIQLQKEMESKPNDDPRIDQLAQDMAELKQIVLSIAPPTGLRRNFNTTGSETSSLASTQSNSAYENTGESTTVSGVVCGLYKRITNGKLYTWRGATGEYKIASLAQIDKRFSNKTLEGGNDNAFNETNTSGVDINDIRQAKLNSSAKFGNGNSKVFGTSK